VSRHQNVGQNYNLFMANKSFGNVAKFRNLRTTATNQSRIQEDIKNMLNMADACYHLFSVFCHLVSSVMTLRLKHINKT
jgi:hypothetical protein